MAKVTKIDRRSFLAGLGSMLTALSIPGLTSSGQGADQP